MLYGGVSREVLELCVRPRVVIVLVKVNHFAFLRLHRAQRLDKSLLLLLHHSVQLIDVLIIQAILGIGREVVRVPGGGEALRHRRRTSWAVVLAGEDGLAVLLALFDLLARIEISSGQGGAEIDGCLVA